MQKVSVPLKRIDKIYHISDVHIRNLKRHKEYRIVFDRLYDEIKKDTENAVIAVLGDVAHAKTDMSPELIDMISEFFSKLADIAPTLVIPGNHDCNLNNLSRLDALEPIIKNLKHENLHYFKHSGVFGIANIDFFHYSVFDSMKKYPKALESDAATKIAMYHGAIKSATLDTGMKIEGKITKRFFDGLDIALLGDIHKQQDLQKYEVKEKEIEDFELVKFMKYGWTEKSRDGKKVIIERRKPAMSYSSSLIQQNHGEDYFNHGIIKWDVKNRKPEFIKIENDYGFYTIRIKDNVVPDIKDLPKIPRLRVEVENTSVTHLKDILAEIRTKYHVKDLVVNSIDNELKLDKNRINSYKQIGDIHDVEYQNALMDEFLKNVYGDITEDDLTLVKEINRELNNKLETSDMSYGAYWKLKSLKFSNMFSYGEDNFVDFTQLKEINGLFAPNASGKSSLIDVLLFALLDKTSRSTKTIDVLNVNKNEFDCEVIFDYNGRDYHIKKTGTRTRQNYKEAVRVEIDFWTFEDNGDKKSLNGDQRRSTNQNIQEKIGTFENLVLTNVSLQGNNSGIIMKKQTERNELLTSFLDMGIFKELYDLGKSESNANNGVLKEFAEKDFRAELIKLEKESLDVRKQMELLQIALTGRKTKRQKLNTQILDISKTLESTDEILDIEFLTEQRTDLNDTISTLDEQLDKNQQSIKLVTDSVKKLSVKLDSIDEDSLKVKHGELVELMNTEDNLRDEIEKIGLIIQYQQEKLKKLDKLKYDEKCDFCMNNIFVKDAIATKELFQKTDEKLKAKEHVLSELQTNVSASMPIVKEFETMNDLYSDRDELKKLFVTATQNKTIIEEKLELNHQLMDSNKSKIETYYKNVGSIEFNKKKVEQIDSLKIELEELDEFIDKKTDELQDLSGTILVNNSKIVEINRQVEVVKRYEVRQRGLQFYLKALHRTGIQYELIKNIVPSIEAETNAILDQLVDFNILIDLDDAHIDMYIAYKTGAWSLTLTSGMEKFISSIALRVALNKITKLPHPNFFIIDEGWGNLDSENLNQLYILFNYLKNQYDWTLIVSHLDSMRDVIDKLVDIQKVDGYSKVKFVK